MCRPFKRYSHHLAERLGKSINELYACMDSGEIVEWMAYDRTSDQNWVKEYEREIEIERSKSMSIKDKVAAFKKLFGGVTGKSKD